MIPPNTSSIYTLTLPSSAGSSGQFLSTNGSGLLSWSTLNTSSLSSIGLVNNGTINIVAASNSGYTLTLPSSAGSSGQFLTTNGSGLLSWSTLNTSSLSSIGLVNNGTINIVAASNSGYTLTLPSSAGSSGQFLTTNGSGLLSWSSATLTNQWSTWFSNYIYYSKGIYIGGSPDNYVNSSAGLVVELGITNGIKTALVFTNSSNYTAIIGSHDLNTRGGVNQPLMLYGSPLYFNTSSGGSNGNIMTLTGSSNGLTGNVGIWTTSPNAELHVCGSSIITGQLSLKNAYNSSTSYPTWALQIIDTNQQYSSTQGIGLTFGNNNTSDYNAGYLQYVCRGYNNSSNYVRMGVWGSGQQLYVTASGYVGIGTYEPSFPLQVSGYNTYGRSDGLSYFMYSPNVTSVRADFSGTATNSQWWDGYYINRVSIYTSNIVWSDFGFVASSDMRIKSNIIQADTSIALSKILQLPLMKYNYIDYISDGTSQVYGMIAQTVKQVLPEAVTLQTNVIPSIYKLASNVVLNNNNIIISVSIDSSSELKVGGNVELIIENMKDKYKTKVISFTTSELVVARWEDFDETKKVFVYGAQIDDFHTVDKHYLGILCMGGIQELSKKNDILTQQVATLIQQMNKLLEN
jgi:hypothetical protein